MKMDGISESVKMGQNGSKWMKNKARYPLFDSESRPSVVASALVSPETSIYDQDGLLSRPRD